ncbi:MAG TPA: tRNA (adenosine(37)-N6)-threonylcarbamoyltransferase complex ATPase subunit type 1 TsaE [Bacteroidia bacterium]|nr:tRNA (adenosine(37)-N6)-threonylcarbamoyltransferase complex ATPase subunit type 1 TsaE [Bacteroidia bacterium]
MATTETAVFEVLNPLELHPVADEILGLFPADRIFTLEGPMGSGKTTLVQAFCKALGCNDTVASPTFTLVNEYRSNKGEPLYHFDFYRINSPAEVFDMGFEEYLYSGNYCFIEWPSIAGAFLSGSEVKITIGVSGASRKITVSK